MITIIFGECGAGKTALMTHLLNQSNFDLKRYNNMCNSLQDISDTYNLDIINTPNTHVMANYNINFFKFGYTRNKNLYVNPFKIGFKNKFVDVQRIPPFAFIGIDEAQEYFNSRLSKYYPSWQSRFYEKHRHFDLDFILVAQRADLIDINIRDLAHFIDIEELRIINDNNGIPKKLVWKVRKINSVRKYNRYINSDCTDKSCYKTEKIIADYNVFACYDSKAEKTRFIETYIGQETYFEDYSSSIEDLDELIKYLEKYNSLMPKGFYQKGSTL